MEALDISHFDVGDFDVLGSSVQKFIDEAFHSDYFNVDMYDTTDETSELSLLDEDEHPPRKRKVCLTELQQQYKLSRPRIVKSDFRRNFAQIWAGVFNSTDYETMMDHIRSFYDSDVSVYQNDLRLDLSYGNKTRGPMIGHEYLSELWYRSMQIAPDQVCVLQHTFVKVRSDGTSSVKCSFCLEGTKVVKVENAQTFGDLKTSVVCIHQAKYDENYFHAHCRVAAFRKWNKQSPDDLDRFVSTDSFDSTDSSCSSRSEGTLCPEEISAETESLQSVLQRYLKAADAVVRSKSKEGTRKRRRRERNAESEQPIALEDWLAPLATEAADASKENDSVSKRPVRPVQYARIVDNIAYIQPVDTCTLRGDNDSKLPLVRAYKVEHQQGEVVLTAPLKSTCSVELNFNADHRIVSVILNFIE